jgi:hypothetical protein
MLLAHQLSAGAGVVFPEYHDNDTLVMITPAGKSASESPEMSFEVYHRLREHTGDVLAAIAFYQLLPARAGELRLGVANAELAAVLDIPVNNGVQVILTKDAWRRRFKADSEIAGRLIHVEGRPAVIAGVVPEGLAQLPGKVDGWLIDDQYLLHLPAGSLGFVAAR